MTTDHHPSKPWRLNEISSSPGWVCPSTQPSRAVRSVTGRRPAWQPPSRRPCRHTAPRAKSSTALLAPLRPRSTTLDNVEVKQGGTHSVRYSRVHRSRARRESTSGRARCPHVPAPSAWPRSPACYGRVSTRCSPGGDLRESRGMAPSASTPAATSRFDGHERTRERQGGELVRQNDCTRTDSTVQLACGALSVRVLPRGATDVDELPCDPRMESRIRRACRVES